MDLAIRLALMAKATKVFGTDRTFLSFPLTPLSFTKQRLEFLSDFNVTNLKEFSLLVDQIPDGEAWLPSNRKGLSEIYDEILIEGDFARSSRTPQEEVAYQEAFNYLHITKDGTRADTDIYTKYKQHKDAFIRSQESYLVAKSTGEVSTDPAEKQQWQIDEPKLRQRMNECEQLWILEGRKHEVEAAVAKESQLGARSPQTIQAEWQGRFNKEIDRITDPTDQISVYPSVFAPSNALDDGCWQSSKLTADAVKALLDQAPGEMRSRLGVDNIDPTLDYLTFEYSTAKIQRHWWQSNVLESSFWRFSDPSKVLSDGMTPAVGDCTAYVTAVVFVRNVTIVKKAIVPTKPFIIDHIKFPIQEIVTEMKIIDALVAPNQGEVRDHRQVESNVNSFMARMMPIATEQDAPVAPNIVQPLMNPMDFNINQAPSLKNQALFQALKGATFTRLDAQTTGAEIIQGKMRLSSDTDSPIEILAFICQKVPRCPDPDPTLPWE
jgi:hypothetical protein